MTTAVLRIQRHAAQTVLDLSPSPTLVEPVPGRNLTLVTSEPGTSPTFREVGDLWFTSRRNLKPSTLVSYESQLRLQIGRFIGDRPIDQLGVEDLVEWIADVEEAGYKPVTIRNAYATATAVFNFAVRRKLIPSNPAKLLPGRERPRVTQRRIRILTAAEIEALLTAADEPWRTLYATSVFGGLRSGESRGLQWDDLYGERLRVRRQAQDGKLIAPKTDNARREIVMLDPLPRIFDRFRACQLNAHPTDCLFLEEDGKLIRAPRLLYQLRKHAELAGIEQHPDELPLRFHDLRHTCASIMIAARADVSFVARQLGHASSATTLKIYSHLFDESSNVDRVREYVNGQFGSLGTSGGE